IRRVFIHLFFPGQARVHDREIEPILEKTLIRKRPRDFYYALMDYGSALGKGSGEPDGPSRRGKSGNPNARSASYIRQGPFEGSDRQARGIIIRRVLAEGEIREDRLGPSLEVGPERLERILRGLAKDGFVDREKGRIRCRETSGESR
ncbi:MAG TPA: hypothetical protein VKO45_07015, partial [Methanomicrobiales archaeon]|nr:hypothetical protein [Methanomicrobiales archaeon]